jgi:cobalt-zinc-cadmium efflux system membrane fusion protein
MKYILASVMILFALASCTADKKVQETPIKKDPDLLVLSQQQLKGVNVAFTRFTERQIRPIIHANGVIKLLPESKAEVSSHISGKVEKIFVREGMRVAKGQALMQISSFEALELQNEYVAALSDAEFQAVEFKRQEELMQKKIGVLADYQSSKARYQSALAKEHALEQKLSLIGISSSGLSLKNNEIMQRNITIKSPINGFVNTLSLHLGSLVTAETILAEIIDPDQTQAEVFVYEKDAEFVAEGLPVQIEFMQMGIPSVEGKILYVSRALDPTSKTITLHVSFPKPSKEVYLANMNIKATIQGIIEKKSNYSVPSTALYDNGDATYLFLTNDPKSNNVSLRKTCVEVEQAGDSFVSIRTETPLSQQLWIADNNVLSLEAERKKNE